MSRFVPRRKDEIEMRYDHGRTWPAVNIKVYNNIWDVKLPNPEMPGLTHEWLELHMKDEEIDGWFWETCNWDLEYFIDWAKEIVDDPNAKFYQDGRSGGWLVYESDPEYWDAVAFAKWRKICRVSRAVADGIWESALNNIWANVYERYSEWVT